MKGLLGTLGAVVIGWFIINLIGALLVGALARRILPGKDSIGWFQTIAVGFLGGILGKVLAFVAGYHHLGIIGQFAVSVCGAIVLLVAHRVWLATKAKQKAAS